MKKRLLCFRWIPVLALALLAAVSCGSGGSESPQSPAPPADPKDSAQPAPPAGPADSSPPSIRIVSTHESDFASSVEGVPGGMVSVGGYTVHLGEYSAGGRPPLRFALGLRKDADIDRALVVINGGTGTSIEFLIVEELPPGRHKAVLIVGQGGMSEQDKETACELGSGLAECLKKHETLRAFNPRQNGEDTNRLVGLIQKSDQIRSVLSRPEGPVDVRTGSYGATILGYALSNADYPPPAMRNVSIDGPSEPNELVITSGIANSKRFFANLLSYRASVQPSARSYSIEDLTAELAANPGKHIGGLFDQMYEDWEDRDGGPAKAVAQMNRFIEASDKSSYYKDDWDAGYKFPLITSPNFQLSKEGVRAFTSRIGQICSAYVNRTNSPDSSARYAAALESADGVFRYGFLNKYRDMLTLCPQIADATARLTAPSGTKSADAYAVLVYAGAMDDKHSPEEVDAMLAYFSDSTIKHRVVEQYNSQGGGVKPMCFFTARSSMVQRNDGTIDRSDCSQ